MTPTDPSITYLLGAGMVHDVCEWIAIALLMLACAVTLGILLGVWRKRRIAKMTRRAEIALKNWEHFVPMWQSDVLPYTQYCNGRIEPLMVPPQVHSEQVGITLPAAPACGVAQSCNECHDCPDIHRAPIESLDV